MIRSYTVKYTSNKKRIREKKWKNLINHINDIEIDIDTLDNQNIEAGIINKLRQKEYFWDLE